VRIGAALLIALSASVACAGERGRRSDSASGSTTGASTAATVRADSPTTATPPRATAPATPTCVSEGEWQVCSVEKRLTDAGFVPIRKGAAPTGVFDVPGTTYTLGSAELSVYLFASAKAREAAVAGIDTVSVAKRGRTLPWAAPPTLITSNNLAAVLVSDNGRLIERVQNAITAGLPSAPR
jgi:hypothetical protein